MFSDIIATADWEMLGFNLFLRKDQEGEKERKREREGGKFAPRDAPRESNNWSFQFLALRLTPDASPSIVVVVVAVVRRLVQPVYNAYMYPCICVGTWPASPASYFKC